jgi:integrase
MILPAYDTGMRKGEVLKVRRAQLDLRESCLRLGAEDTKTDRPRNVYLTARTLDALRALPRHLDSEFVFVNPRTGRRGTTSAACGDARARRPASPKACDSTTRAGRSARTREGATCPSRS